jgi:hypothetical protein
VRRSCGFRLTRRREWQWQQLGGAYGTLSALVKNAVVDAFYWRAMRAAHGNRHDRQPRSEDDWYAPTAGYRRLDYGVEMAVQDGSLGSTRLAPGPATGTPRVVHRPESPVGEFNYASGD